MRIALLSESTATRIALDAVLADIDRHGGADHHWLLGDLVAMGPGPDRRARTDHRDTAGAEFVRGNTDRYVVTGERPPPTIEDVVGDPD